MSEFYSADRLRKAFIAAFPEPSHRPGFAEVIEVIRHCTDVPSSESGRQEMVAKIKGVLERESQQGYPLTRQAITSGLGDALTRLREVPL